MQYVSNLKVPVHSFARPQLIVVTANLREMQFSLGTRTHTRQTWLAQGWVKSAERKVRPHINISFGKVATTQENIFLLVLEFSDHLPRFRPCIYKLRVADAFLFHAFRACMAPQVHFKLVTYHCCLSMEWSLLVATYL